MANDPRGKLCETGRKCAGPARIVRVRTNGREPEAMKFTKMQGIGNDYIYVNAFE